MSDLHGRIFSTLFNHDSGYYVDETTMACCFCGETYGENGKQAHQADAVIRELALDRTLRRVAKLEENTA